jgi:hypothetical protein
MTETIIGGIVATVVGGLILAQIIKWNNRNSEKKSKKELIDSNTCEKLIVFLSTGGTCRDPMAKVITLQALKNKDLPYKICVKGMGLGPLAQTMYPLQQSKQ